MRSNPHGLGTRITLEGQGLLARFDHTTTAAIPGQSVGPVVLGLGKNPSAELVRRVVEARLRPALEELPNFADLPSIYPFTEEHIVRVARTEPTLRDMLQQFRHLFDHLVYGEVQKTAYDSEPAGNAPSAVPIPCSNLAGSTSVEPPAAWLAL